MTLQDEPVSTSSPSRFSTYSLQGRKRKGPLAFLWQVNHRVTRQTWHAVVWCSVIPGGAAAVDLDPVRKLLARVTVARAGISNLEAVEVALCGAGAGNTGLQFAKIKSWLGGGGSWSGQRKRSYRLRDRSRKGNGSGGEKARNTHLGDLRLLEAAKEAGVERHGSLWQFSDL